MPYIWLWTEFDIHENLIVNDSLPGQLKTCHLRILQQDKSDNQSKLRQEAAIMAVRNWSRVAMDRFEFMVV